MSDYIASSIYTLEEIQIGLRSRAPLQERSQQRVACGLKTAEYLLILVGPEETSIPEIAIKSGVPRASLYQFYPNKYAIFAHLAQIHLLRLEYIVKAKTIEAIHQNLKNLETIVTLLTNIVADYYDASPVASILILGGPFSQSSYQAQESMIGSITHTIREFFNQVEPPLFLPEKPDVVTLVIEIAFACMKHGYYQESFISPMIREQAAKASLAYLKCWENN
jgi:AcrR family transcriptional regulator